MPHLNPEDAKKLFSAHAERAHAPDTHARRRKVCYAAGAAFAVIFAVNLFVLWRVAPFAAAKQDLGTLASKLKTEYETELVPKVDESQATWDDMKDRLTKEAEKELLKQATEQKPVEPAQEESLNTLPKTE